MTEAPTPSPKANGNTKALPALPSDLVDAAKKEALADAGGKKLGGSITLIGQLGGAEAQFFQDTFKPFEDATGVKIQFTLGQNYQQIVQTRVAAGDPPDVVNDNGMGNAARYASQGKLIAFSDFLDMAKLDADYGSALLGGYTINGKLYGLPAEIAPQMVFYNANTYKGPKPFSAFSQMVSYSQQVADGGKTPWCAAYSASAQTGWPAAYFIEEIFAKTYGAAELNKWGLGQIPFTSPEVKTAFQTYGQIFGKSVMISGGVSGALAKPIAQGPLGLFTDPANCQLFAWGIYAVGNAETANPKLQNSDFGFFPIPAPNANFANNEQASGWALYAFHDTPQVKALAKYYSSSAYQSLLAESGEWVVANKKVTNYANPLVQQAAAQLSNAAAVGFGPYFGQTVAVKTAFLKAITTYLQDPSTLDQDLAATESVVKSSGR